LAGQEPVFPIPDFEEAATISAEERRLVKMREVCYWRPAVVAATADPRMTSLTCSNAAIPSHPMP
jgi:hypothetical protein